MTDCWSTMVIRIALVGQAWTQAGVTPALVLVQPVELVTRGDARLAPRTPVEVHLEGVLLAVLRRPQRDQVAIVLRLHRLRAAGVPLGELLDGGQALLLLEVAI